MTAAIDRKTICPLLLRMFVSEYKFYRVQEFLQGKTPSDELTIHTWMDANLKEFSRLIGSVNYPAGRKGSYLDFALVGPDPRSESYRMREIGSVKVGADGADDKITLRDINFKVGDYINVAITPPAAPESSNDAPANRRRRI